MSIKDIRVFGDPVLTKKQMKLKILINKFEI